MDYCATLILLIGILDVRGDIIVSPANAAEMVGGNSVPFNCTSSYPIAPPNWSFNGEPIVYNGCQTSSTYFSTNNESSISTCNLIVLHPTLSLAGTYTCEDGFAGSASAYFTVLESSPIISINVSDSVVQGQSVKLTCSVSYNGPTVSAVPQMPPSLILTSSDVTVPNYFNTTTTTTVTNVTVILAHIPEVPAYQCHAIFNPTQSNAADISNNSPSFTSSSTPSPIIPVEICPTNMEISGASSDGYIEWGQMLTCQVTASPAPSISWFDSVYNNITCGPSIPIWHPGVYNCTATTVVQGSLCFAVAGQNITNTSEPIGVLTSTLYSTRPTSNQPPTTLLTTPTIVAIILGLLLVLSLAVNAILIFKRCRHESSHPKRQAKQEDSIVGDFEPEISTSHPDLYSRPPQTYNNPVRMDSTPTWRSTHCRNEGVMNVNRGVGGVSMYDCGRGEDSRSNHSSNMTSSRSRSRYDPFEDDVIQHYQRKQRQGEHPVTRNSLQCSHGWTTA